MITGGLLLLGYSRTTSIGPALAAAGLAFGALNAAAPPIFLTLIPPHLTGRVMSVLNPLQQAASITSIALAGLLAGTALQHFHARIPGVTLGPVDTIFGASAILITTAGLIMIRPLTAVPGHPRRSGEPRSP